MRPVALGRRIWLHIGGAHAGRTAKPTDSISAVSPSRTHSSSSIMNISFVSAPCVALASCRRHIDVSPLAPSAGLLP